MARIADLLAAGPTLSFEFGPPRDDDAEQRLQKTLVDLEPLAPAFVSVTYGAGGSTRGTTARIVDQIATTTSMTVMPHLTCVGHTRAQITEIVGAYRDAGIENLLALAGDPPADGGDHPADFRYATELVEEVKEIGDFSIGVAAFPEVHPRSVDAATYRGHLAAKLAMADFGITQFFFDVEPYLRMRDELAALGVERPVLPGVMAFTNVAGVRRMSAMNGTRIPDDLQRRLDLADGTPSAVRELAVEVSCALGRRLLDAGAPGIHLYTMNFSRATTEIVHELGLR